MLAGFTMSARLSAGTVLARRAAAPATTGLATDVPDNPLYKQKERHDFVSVTSGE